MCGRDTEFLAAQPLSCLCLCCFLTPTQNQSGHADIPEMDDPSKRN